MKPTILTLLMLLAGIGTGACQTQPVKPVTNPPAPITHYYAVLPNAVNAGTGFNFYETFTNLPPVMMLTNQPWNGTNAVFIKVVFNSGQGRWFTAEATNAATGEAAQYGTSVYTNAPAALPNPATALGQATIFVTQ